MIKCPILFEKITEETLVNQSQGHICACWSTCKKKLKFYHWNGQEKPLKCVQRIKYTLLNNVCLLGGILTDIWILRNVSSLATGGGGGGGGEPFWKYTYQEPL